MRPSQKRPHQDATPSSFLDTCQAAKRRAQELLQSRAQQLAAEQKHAKQQETALARREVNTAAIRNKPQPSRNAPTRVAAESFYGPQHAAKIEAVERVIQQYQRQQARSRAVYREFPRQADAMQWADEQGSNVRIWSAQRDNGSRFFIAASYHAFWQHYIALEAEQRHHYEIIREGVACKLYFDLEYELAYNEGTNGTALVDKLLQIVDTALQREHGIQLEDCSVIELDSTTDTKFSHHLVIGLPKAAFKSNLHVGAFVRSALQGAAGQQLMINKDAEGNRTLCVDMAVYTRNRAFRLYLSSKAGKTYVLQTTGRFGHPVASTAAGQRELFMASLITNCSVGAKLLTAFEDASTPVAMGSAVGPSRGPALGPASAAREGPCPYADLEAYMVSCCKGGGVQGSIRSWVHWPEQQLLLFNIGGRYRWCGHIQRHHKSNGVYFIVDIGGRYWYQKCYDPECRQYRSECRPLPPDVACEGPCVGDGEAANVGNACIFNGESLPDDLLWAAAVASGY